MEKGLRAEINPIDDACPEEVQEEIKKELTVEELIQRYSEIQ